MNAIRKTKHRCNICGDCIAIIRHNRNFNYCKCDRCNIVYVVDRKTDKYVRAYEPRKMFKLN